MAATKKVMVVSFHLLAHAGFVMAMEKKLKVGAFGKYLGVTPSTASLYFVGNVDLRTSRVFGLCEWLGASPGDLYEVAGELISDLNAHLKVPIQYIPNFPEDAPLESVRILRAHELNACWLADEIPTLASGYEKDASLMHEDDFWRLRQKAKLSREQLARKMGVAPETIRHWERTKFSGPHWGELALKAAKS
jgi:transcriptional regulator with XRE-family HTH domain